MERALVSRYGMPKNAEQFAEWMLDDFKTAKLIYDEKSLEEYNRVSAERREKAWQDANKRFREYVNNRYKRQSTRDKHFVILMTQWDVEHEKRNYAYLDKFTYVDWDIKPWEMGVTCIDERTTAESLAYMFKSAIGNKYFEGATGWDIVIETNEDSWHSLYRPYVRLHLNKELQEQWDADEKKLSDSVSNFYKGSNWWGD